MDSFLEVLKNIGKFILGALIKSIVIALAILLIWLIICVVKQNSFGEGFKHWAKSDLLTYIIGWFALIIINFSKGDIQHVLIGLLMFFAPVILIQIATPDPDIELYDASGNLWKLRKG